MRYTCALLLILCTAVMGCGKKTVPRAVTPPPAVADAEPPAPAPPPQPPPPAATPAPLTEDDLFNRKSLDELNAERPLADVFFDFDQWSVRADARTPLARNAEWLRRWPSVRIRIDGHCDERGTTEYNLSLGERRADAISRYLAELGIPPDRVLVVSKGKEAPFCADETEDCWQQNRRAHFVITAK